MKKLDKILLRLSYHKAGRIAIHLICFAILKESAINAVAGIIREF